MASREQFELEQKQRSLRMKEEALLRQQQQQQLTEERLKTHQHEVAETERANQLKIQDIIKREQKLADEETALGRERHSLLAAQRQLSASQKTRSAIVIPILLLACIGAGYMAFDHLNNQKQYFEQVATASKNIDKLAKVLTFTQDEVLSASEKLSAKKGELVKTKSMLSDLRATTEQLQSEIVQIRSSQQNTAEEKAALALSATMLSEQLTSLHEQLEDKYLTNDINEAFIDYQESDLQKLQVMLSNQASVINKRDQSLDEKNQKLRLLEQTLDDQKQQIAELNALLASKNSQLETLQITLKAAEQKNQGATYDISTSARMANLAAEADGILEPQIVPTADQTQK